MYSEFPREKEVFVFSNLEEYRTHPDIVGALDGAVLLNHNEFMNWYSPPEIRIGERDDRKEKTKSIRQRSIDVVEAISIQTLEDMANKVCENKIGISYGISAIRRLNLQEFDILVALAPDYENVEKDVFTKSKKTLEKRIKHILGFIIVEKGECRKLSNSYSVNLICSRTKLEYTQYGKNRNQPRRRVKAGLLMGAYLYCIKKLGQRQGILELAGGYKNISGFMSYSKMGFTKDTKLFGRDCFKDFGNLPMSIELGDSFISYEKIIGLASGKHILSADAIADSTRLIRLPSPKNNKQKEIQRELAVIANLAYQIYYIDNHSFVYHDRLDREELKILKDFEQTHQEKTHSKPKLMNYVMFFMKRKNELLQEYASAIMVGEEPEQSLDLTISPRKSELNKSLKRKRKSIPPRSPLSPPPGFSLPPRSPLSPPPGFSARKTKKMKSMPQ